MPDTSRGGGECARRTLSCWRQWVTCPTRKDKTIDLFYSNVKDGYLSLPLAPLCGSDHNLVLLPSKYTPLVHRQSISSKSVRVWSEDACEDLRGCFERTDWTVFYDDEDSNVDNIAECVTAYINFCTDMIIPCKTIKSFANNKPWVTKEIKAAINNKKRAFRKGDKNKLKLAQKNLKRAIRQGKRKYKDRVESKLQQGDSRGLWKGMKLITGYGPTSAK
ncbi:hypothetical protein N1851_024135 [Merluccius polli]|uniref:Endonuclease/exonuclease/phosphatase domain-containing protein n=1 Tax=Merluccius polli TaxID=89951 RepID=A0AA47MF90_MERPO|nr:hypothetical protein N1851_024135 [Merluccius polli]